MELKIQTHDDEIQVVLDTLAEELAACEKIEEENPELDGLTRAHVLSVFMGKVEKQLENYNA
jgi:hypothetical protein